MGERDDRIDALKRAEAGARRGLGGVDRKYDSERNAPVSDADRDEQIAALTSQRSSLQEQLARVQGELSELERGRDAERQAALGRDAQESKQQISVADQSHADAGAQADRLRQGADQQPATTNQLDPSSPPQGSGADRELSATQQLPSQDRSSVSGSNPSASRSDEKQPQERDKGFPPFEKPDTAPYGFDPKDISKEPVNFQRVDPNEGNFLWGQAKSPASDLKPYSQVLHNGQAAELDALAKDIRREDAAAQQMASTLALDKDARAAFDRAQFEFAAEKMNQKFADQDRQREQFGSNPLLDSHQPVVDREMALKRWDVTRDLCRGQATRELEDVRSQLRSEVDSEQQRLEASDQSMLALYEKRVASQADAQQRLADYDKMLTENRQQQLGGFKTLKDNEFTLAVEDRTDALQAQHFPEIHKTGPEQYIPPSPTLSVGDDRSVPQPQGPAGPGM